MDLLSVWILLTIWGSLDIVFIIWFPPQQCKPKWGMLQLFLISITNLQEKLWLAFFQYVEKNCVVHLCCLRILIRHRVALLHHVI